MENVNRDLDAERLELIEQLDKLTCKEVSDAISLIPVLPEFDADVEIILSTTGAADADAQ